MCGLAGILREKSNSSIYSRLNRMAQTLVHRGPDHSGIWVDEESRIGLAHTRLSILDLSSNGNQPMHSSSNRYVIIFSGEIYNHHEIRSQLKSSGHIYNWRSTSDTEVLLASIEVWGLEATLARIVGMFAIALWDRTTARLTLARDRIGEKPL